MLDALAMAFRVVVYGMGCSKFLALPSGLPRIVSYSDFQPRGFSMARDKFLHPIRPGSPKSAHQIGDPGLRLNCIYQFVEKDN